MTDDRDDFILTQAQLAEAHLAMSDKKLLGTWDPSGGDVPIRIGPLPIPPGYRTLSDVCAKWISLTPGEDRDAVSDAAVNVVLDALIGGHVQAFAVGQDHRLSAIPSTLWLHLREDAGGEQNARTCMVDDCLVGAAFEPHYVGGTAVVAEVAFEKIRQVPSPKSATRSVRPWEAFSSVKAWLADPVAATRFADELLASEGVPSCSEAARRRVLLKYLGDNGRATTKESLAAMRRHGGHS